MEPLHFTASQNLNQRATMGLIVLQEDETIELDFRRLLPDDIALHVSRVASGQQVTPQSLESMRENLAASASLFPAAAEFDCVGYACTSGTSVIGTNDVELRINAGCSTRHVSNPVSGIIAACAHLGITRIALLTPYIPDVSNKLRDVLDQAGIASPSVGSFNQADEAIVARIDEASILNAAETLAKDADMDAMFISCTNLRALDAIRKIEASIGKPVLSSNQVLAWHMAKLAGVSIRHQQFGELFK